MQQEPAQKQRSARTGPCPYALAMTRVPAKRWRTRADVLACVEAARLRMDSDEGSPLTLADVGRACGLSPYHLQRLFTKVYGISPHRYLRERRLVRAHTLLASGAMGVLEACVEVGFSSAASFSRLFRSRFGIPPSLVKGVAAPDSQESTSLGAGPRGE